jgi:XTP/dITP diphosphohydrolase
VSRRLLVIATRNRHKLREIRAVLRSLEVELRSCDDLPGCPEAVEDADTLEANAAKKAREVCEYAGEWTLADDSGLEVEALNGAPGVYSARWAGPRCTYDDNNDKLLRELAAVPPEQRTARFRCVIALAFPERRALGTSRSARERGAGAAVETVRLFEGRIEGRIADARRGAGGFGYDPLFYIPSAGCTLAELPAARKNQVSHRALALRAFRAALEIELQQTS